MKSPASQPIVCQPAERHPPARRFFVDLFVCRLFSFNREIRIWSEKVSFTRCRKQEPSISRCHWCYNQQSWISRVWRMDFLNLLEGESLFLQKFNLVRVSQSLESIKVDDELIISRNRPQLRSYLRRTLAEIKFIINRLPKRALGPNRCDKIDSIFHDEFPVASPSHPPTRSISLPRRKHSAVCALLISTRRFSTFFLRRHGVEERRRTKRNQQGKWKTLIIDFLNVILRLPCHPSTQLFKGFHSHTHAPAPALGRCWSRSREDFRALQAPSHLISLAGVRCPCLFAFVRV